MTRPWMRLAVWMVPHEAKAKRLDIRLTNKNRAKLRSAWIDWCFREYESSVDLYMWCFYGQGIVKDLIYSHNPFLSMLRAKRRWDEVCPPVPLPLPPDWTN